MTLKISENIKKLRESANITQSELAEALAVTPQSVSRWENGQAYPDIEKLPQLAAFFGVTIDELMGNCKPKLYVISQELARVRKQLDENTREIRLEYLDLLEQSVNIGSNRFLCEYYNASRKMAKDKIVTEQKYSAVKETVRKKLLEMNAYERASALTVIVANEDKENLSQWEEFIGSDNNRACWHDILLLRHFIHQDEINFTLQRQEVLFQDISKILFLINQKSAPNSSPGEQTTTHFGNPDSIENCILVKSILSLISSRDDDIFIFLRITAETRLASTYMSFGDIDNACICFERLKELLLVCKNTVGKTLKGSVGIFSDYEYTAEEYKYENIFFEIEVMMGVQPFFSLKETDKRLSDFALFVEKLHSEIDPFCYLPWPERKHFEKLFDRALALGKRCAKKELSYAFVVETAKGNVYEHVISCGPEQEAETKLFTEMLKNRNDTHIKYLVGVLYDCVQQLWLDMPSHYLRSQLCDLDKRNLDTETLLQGFGAFVQKKFRLLFPKNAELKYES